MIMRILVTGGTGVLGLHLVPALRARGHDVRILTRQEDVFGGAPGDLATGEGLAEACEGAEAVIHAATSHQAAEWKTVDVGGTARLAAAARRAGVQHVVYVSIIGVDAIPSAYYAAKLEAEEQVRLSGVTFTIVRFAQFHELLDSVFELIPRIGAGRVARMPVPGLIRLQPIAAADAAAVLADRLEFAPSGRVEELGGPQIMTGEELGSAWLRAHGKEGRTLGTPAAGGMLKAFAEGRGTSSEHRCPGQTFEDYAAERQAAGTPAAYRFIGVLGENLGAAAGTLRGTAARLGKSALSRLGAPSRLGPSSRSGSPRR